MTGMLVEDKNRSLTSGQHLHDCTENTNCHYYEKETTLPSDEEYLKGHVWARK